MSNTEEQLRKQYEDTLYDRLVSNLGWQYRPNDRYFTEEDVKAHNTEMIDLIEGTMRCDPQKIVRLANELSLRAYDDQIRDSDSRELLNEVTLLVGRKCECSPRSTS